MAAGGSSEASTRQAGEKGDEFVRREQRHGSVGMPDERIKACVMMTAGCALGPLCVEPGENTKT